MKARVQGILSVTLEIDTGEEGNWEATTAADIRDEAIGIIFDDLKSLVAYVEDARYVVQDLSVELLPEPGDQERLLEVSS